MKPETRERPIIFSAPMVRAILAGQKTQTRRVIKPQPDVPNPGTNWTIAMSSNCPYGHPGARLWVRETCRAVELIPGWGGVNYLAGGGDIKIENTESAVAQWWKLYGYRGGCGMTVPPIHMPRWASRISLEITGVRVERVQDISEADALAEGVDRTNTSLPGYATERFRRLWDSINAARGFGWEVNPWVWVIEFRRCG